MSSRNQSWLSMSQLAKSPITFYGSHRTPLEVSQGR